MNARSVVVLLLATIVMKITAIIWKFQDLLILVNIVGQIMDITGWEVELISV